MWQIIVFFVLLSSYPNDGRAGDGNVLVINNMWWNVFYSYALVDFITRVKIVGSFCTDGSTATFVAGVSTNRWYSDLWYRVWNSHIIGVFCAMDTEFMAVQICWPYHISEFLILIFIICKGERQRRVGRGWFCSVVNSLVRYCVNRYQWFWFRFSDMYRVSNY